MGEVEEERGYMLQKQHSISVLSFCLSFFLTFFLCLLPSLSLSHSPLLPSTLFCPLFSTAAFAPLFSLYLMPPLLPLPVSPSLPLFFLSLQCSTVIIIPLTESGPDSQILLSTLLHHLLLEGASERERLRQGWGVEGMGWGVCRKRGMKGKRRVQRHMGEKKIRSMEKGGLLLLQRWSHCNIHTA